MSQKNEVLRNAYMKLDNMVLAFGLPKYTDAIADADIEKYLGIDLKDTLRELRLKSVDSVEEMSLVEMQIENRVVFHALRRFRNTASVYFKFSTATDGKSVDKTNIPKMLLAIINEYDAEFRKWRSTSSAGSLLTIASTVSTNGDVDSAE